MNFRRGLFRLWLVLSLAWIGFMANNGQGAFCKTYKPPTAEEIRKKIRKRLVRHAQEGDTAAGPPPAAESRGKPPPGHYTKSLAEVDESAGNPLISVEYPVGDLRAMPSRSGRQALAFYVCGLLR